VPNKKVKGQGRS